MIFFLILLLPVAFTQKFDANYYAYQKGDEQTFAYDSKRVCKILSHPPHTYARLENAFDQFDRSAVKLLDIEEAAEKIVGCLNYKGYSYLIYTTTTNSTSIIRGGGATRKLPIIMEHLCYDHLHSLLYMIADDAHLYHVRLETLHANWNDDELGELIGDKLLELPVNNITDAFVFNHTLYWLTPYGRVYKQWIHGNETTLVDADYPGTKFNIIPFSGAATTTTSITITENPHIRISSGLDSIILPLPSLSSSNNNITDPSNIFLYILDIIFFLCLIVVLRIATTKAKRRGETKISLAASSKLNESSAVSNEIL